MIKISWTCPECGLWHSCPSDAQGRALFCSLDGLNAIETAFKALVGDCLRDEWGSLELRVRIVSNPLNHVPIWANSAAKQAKNLRSVELWPVHPQEFRLHCKMCGHDATDEFKTRKEKSLMTSIEMSK